MLTKFYKFNNSKEEYKANTNLISFFKYENSDFLNAIKNNEWILLDGIENAPLIIAEKIALLCGESPELNLYDEEVYKPKSGFHLFITYNKERIHQNQLLSSPLFDKCLIYNLNQFVNNEKSISEIIYGFLVNFHKIFKNNDISDIFANISSRLSNIHIKFKQDLNLDKITERTIINFTDIWNLLRTKMTKSFI